MGRAWFCLDFDLPLVVVSLLTCYFFFGLRRFGDSVILRGTDLTDLFSLLFFGSVL